MDVTRSNQDTVGSSKFLPMLLGSRDPERILYFILDVSEGNFSNLTHPRLCWIQCLYSKGGWLLLGQRDRQDEKLFLLFLFNPATGEIIDLPSRDECRRGFFCFSLSSSKPDYVVNVLEDRQGFIIRMINCHGNGEWEKHTFNFVSSVGDRVMGAAVIGKQVLCYGYNGSPVLFNLLDGSWKKSQIKNCPGVRYAMEAEGEFLMVCARSRFCGSKMFSFLSLDLNSLTWDAMSDSDVEKRVWFLGPHQSFCMKGSKGMVYLLRSDLSEERLSESTISTESCESNEKLVLIQILGSSSNTNAVGPTSSNVRIYTPAMRSVAKKRLPTEPLFGNVSLYELCNGVQSVKGFLLPKPFPSFVFHWVDISTCKSENFTC